LCHPLLAALTLAFPLHMLGKCSLQEASHIPEQLS
jgi:hypothetical protein